MLNMYRCVGLSVECLRQNLRQSLRQNLRQGLRVECIRHARIVARKPVRVNMPVTDEAQESLKKYQDMFVKNKKIKQKFSEAEDVKESHDVKEDTTQRQVPDIKQEIKHKQLSQAKDYIRQLLGNVASRKFREKNELFVAEGIKTIKEALDAGAHPEAIYFTRLSQLVNVCSNTRGSFGIDELNHLNTLPLYRTPYKTLQTWSSLTTSPGIIGVFKLEGLSDKTAATKASIPVTLILDEIREPSNMGGILRTAASVGIADVILMKGCCDPWERKAVRAGCGAHFRLRLTLKATWDTLTNSLPEDTQLLLADVCRDTDLDTYEDDENSEQKLISQVKTSENDNSDHKHITQVKTSDNEDTVPDLEESGILYEIDSEGKRLVVDPSYEDEEHLSGYKNIRLPVKYYNTLEPELTTMGINGTVVVIGGETGLSNAAKKFAVINNGVQVAIPLANRMDSLNSSVAAGIILYEINRQYQNLSHHSFTEEIDLQNESNLPHS